MPARNWTVIDRLGDDELWKRFAFTLDEKELAELHKLYPMFFMEDAEDTGPKKFPLSLMLPVDLSAPGMGSNLSILVRPVETTRHDRRKTEFPDIAYRGDIHGMNPPHDLFDVFRGMRIQHPMIAEYKGRRLMLTCLAWSDHGERFPKYGEILEIPRFMSKREVNLTDMRFIDENA